MATTAVNFRLDSDVKKEMESVCKQLGITPTGAFSMFATKVARERRIPFSLSLDPFYEEANIKYVMRGIQQLEDGEGIERDLINA